jgi:hypothetical protein
LYYYVSNLPLVTSKRKRLAPGSQKSITDLFSTVDTADDTPSPSPKRRQLGHRQPNDQSAISDNNLTFDNRNNSPIPDDNKASDIGVSLVDKDNKDGQGFSLTPDSKDEGLNDKDDLLDEVMEEAVLISDNQQEVVAWLLPLRAARRSSNFMYQPFLDEDGWTRVGTQPIKIYSFVQTTPRSTIEAIIRASVRDNLLETDSKLTGSESVAQRISDIQLSTLKRFILHSQDCVEIVCDYTGSKSSWSPSPPSI